MDSLLTFRGCQSILKKMLLTEKDYFKPSPKSEDEQYRVSLQRKLEEEDVPENGEPAGTRSQQTLPF